MDFGVIMFPTDFSIGPAELAIAVEERGLDALFLPDHTHIPVGSQADRLAADQIPEDYIHNLDVFAGLAVASAITERIRLGTGICLVAQRDPIIMAKQVASIDHISGGRFDFGVGVGWNSQEMANHGGLWADRFQRMHEHCEAMKAIWTQEKATYHGEFVNFDDVWSWPKPIQKPYPPILIGGGLMSTLDQVMQFGDGWIPMLPNHEEMERRDVRFAMMADLRGRAAAANREPISITTFRTPRDPAMIDQLRAAGVTRCIFGLKSAPADDVLRRLDRLVQFLETVR